MKCNEIARDIHRKMVDDNRFGYSWAERWGYKAETWTIGGKKYTIKVGDYDCSSSTITAWKLALTGTKYEGKLDAATYTGNMRSVFVGSGLFEWKPMSFLADPGDLYLNESNHVAMCYTQYPDILTEFSGNEFGGAYGGQRGDQTGWEGHVANYYDYPWGGILHYNGKADGTSSGSSSTSKPTPVKPSYDKNNIHFRVSTDPSGRYWLDEMVGHYDTGGSSDEFGGVLGRAIRWIAIKDMKKYRVKTQANGWLPWVNEYNVKDLDNGCAGDGSPVINIEIADSTARYCVHVLGGNWLPDMIGQKDLGGSSDTYAGDDRNPIDALMMNKA